MDWTSAPIIEDAPLEPAHRRFLSAKIGHFAGHVEAFLERERAQLPLWFTASFGAGIAACCGFRELVSGRRSSSLPSA